MKALPVIRSAPVLALWNYGHWCNMDCAHCYSRPEAESASGDMTTAEAESIADQLLEARVMHVHFGGGEPLGRNDFLQVASRLAQGGVVVTLSTNGSLLTEQVADQLAALPLETVAFSIHGSDAESHDAFNHFVGAWQRLVTAIARMVKRDVRTKLVMTLTRPTAPHAPRLLELASSWGVYMVQFQTFKRYGNASRNFSALDLTDEAWRATFAAILETKERLAREGASLKVDLGLDSDPVLAAKIGLPSTHHQCACGTFSVTIRPNGDVCACAFAPEVFGNLHRQRLLDLWRTNATLERIRVTGVSPCEV